MRLFEAIVDANHRAIGGDANASLRPADFEEELPIVALTCVDPRLNPLLPGVLGVPQDKFIWLRNAGNIITGPLSSTMRSLSLACAVKGGKEIAIIGHTDCQVGKTTTIQLLEKLKTLGIERHMLPDNLNEFFGMFGSERQNVLKACTCVRQSPLIGPKIPVHGFLVDIQTGKLEWLVNGYESLGNLSDRWNEVVKSAGQTVDAFKTFTDFQIGEMKFPETKIGETVTKAEDWLSEKLGQLKIQAPEVPPTIESAVNVAEKMVEEVRKHFAKPGGEPKRPESPKLPPPVPIRPRMNVRKRR